jgi:hypothetical protein
MGALSDTGFLIADIGAEAEAGAGAYGFLFGDS